jgi:HlyD family secretion protein
MARSQSSALLALVITAAAGPAWTTAAAQSPAQKKRAQLQELVERFDKLTPVARWQLLDKNTKKADQEFQAARRGDVTLKIVERGSVEPPAGGEIYCTVRSTKKGSTIATTIKSIVDNGTLVKKGDVLVTLDASAFEEQHRDKTKDVKLALAAKIQAEQQVEIQKLDNQAELLTAENRLDLAKIDLKKYTEGEYPQALQDVTGRIALARAELETAKEVAAQSAAQVKKGTVSKAQADADALRVDTARLQLQKVEEEKRVLVNFTRLRTETDLKARISEAQLNMQKAQLQAKAKLQFAQADLQAKTEIYDLENDRLTEVERQIAACTVKAPRAGLVVYHVPEQVRGGAVIVAQGEPVRESQLLLRVCELNQPMKVAIRVPEAQVAQVAVKQKAAVRIDAFPNKVLAAQVEWIDTVASAPDWFAADVRVYAVRLGLLEVVPALRPGMSAEATIEGDRHAGVVTVPALAVLRVGKASYCYIRNGQEVLKREVVPGASNDEVVEIKEGVKEGEQVLRDVGGVLERLSPSLGAAAGPPGKTVAAQKKLPPPQQPVERFDALTPAGRWQLVDKNAKPDKEFQAAGRGDFTPKVVERGWVEPAPGDEVRCTVRAAKKGSTIAGVIKWVVDDGTLVKKGDVVVTVDPSAVEGQAKDVQLKAPRDGRVVYHYSPYERNPFLLAVGEPVREGQLLLQVCEPNQLNKVLIHVPDASITQLAVKQKAAVRIEAYPKKVTAAQVEWIADAVSVHDWFAADVKLRAVRLALLDAPEGLKPGLTAEATIEGERRTGVILVPVSAVLRVGEASYCYVRSGQEILKRQVVPGPRDAQVVQIQEGVKEGEQVLRDPSGLLQRLSPWLGPPAGPAPQDPNIPTKI